MKKNYAIYLTVNLFLLGCASNPVATKFDGNWKFVSLNPESEPMACLPKQDVLKLRELLLKCEALNQK